MPLGVGRDWVIYSDLLVRGTTQADPERQGVHDVPEAVLTPLPRIS